MARSASSAGGSRASSRRRRSRAPWSSSGHPCGQGAGPRPVAARPYSEQITSVILDLVQAGAAKDDPLLRDNPDANVAAVVVVTSSRRGLCGGYNSSVIRLAEREIKAYQEAGQGLRPHRGGHQGRAVLPLPELPHRRQLRRATATSPPTRTPAGSRPRRASASSPAAWPRSTWRTPATSTRARRRPSSGGSCPSRSTWTRPWAAGGTLGRPRVRAVAVGHPRRDPAPLRREPDLLGPARSRVRRPSTPPGSGP